MTKTALTTGGSAINERSPAMTKATTNISISSNSSEGSSTMKTTQSNGKGSSTAMTLFRSVAAAAVLAGAGVTAALTGAGQAHAAADNAEKIAMYSKPAVVRVLQGCAGDYYWPRLQKTYEEEFVGTGSGFFVHSSGYIATNAHATEYAKNPEKCQEALFGRFAQSVAADYDLDLETMSRANLQQFFSIVKKEARQLSSEHMNYIIIPNGSYMPYEIKSYGAPVGEGKDVAIVKIEVRNAPTLKIADSDKVRLQEHITVAGYPAAADTMDSGILNQRSIIEASFTDGRVSARKATADGAPVIQVSAPATHGNSGGPVLNDNGEVIGLLTFRGDTVGNQEISGFSFVVASNTVMEFVRQAGTSNEQSAVDSAYRDGLNLYWQGKFQAAMAKFDEVRRLFPQHSEVERLVRECQEQITAGSGSSNAAPANKGGSEPVALDGDKSGKSSNGAAAGAAPAGSAPSGVISPDTDFGAKANPGNGTSIWDLGTQPMGMGASAGLLALAAVAAIAGKRGSLFAKLAARNQASNCPRCGGALRPGTRFCTGCGAKLDQ